jgi:hypothetical protein
LPDDPDDELPPPPASPPSASERLTWAAWDADLEADELRAWLKAEIERRTALATGTPLQNGRLCGP